MATTNIPSLTDLLSALSRLTSEQLLARLADLHIEEEQLHVLLRAARARERARRIMRPEKEVLGHV